MNFLNNILEVTDFCDRQPALQDRKIRLQRDCDVLTPKSPASFALSRYSIEVARIKAWIVAAVNLTFVKKIACGNQVQSGAL